MEDNEVKITGVTQANIQYFRPLLMDYEISGSNIMLGAVKNDTACGILIAHTENITHNLILTYLYIAPDFREEGIASFLLDQIQILQRKDQVEDIMVRFWLEDQDLGGLFQTYGFQMQLESLAYNFKIKDCKQNQVLEKYKNYHFQNVCKSFQELSRLEQGKSMLLLQKASYDDSLLTRKGFAPEISYAIFGKKEPEAFLLCSRAEGEIQIDLLVNMSTHVANVMQLMCKLYQQVEQSEEEQTKLSFLAVNEEIAKTMQKLIGEKLQSTQELVLGVLRPLQKKNTREKRNG